MAVAMITMQVTRGKRDGGGNAVASTAENSQICGNGIVSAGLWFYCSCSFLENHSLLQHATFFLNTCVYQLISC